jgi:transposase-like protein
LKIKRRTNVVGIFPNDPAVARLVTAVVVESWVMDSSERYLRSETAHSSWVSTV